MGEKQLKKSFVFVSSHKSVKALETMGTVVGTCMPETEHHQTTHLSTLAPIRRRRYGKSNSTPTISIYLSEIIAADINFKKNLYTFVSPASRTFSE